MCHRNHTSSRPPVRETTNHIILYGCLSPRNSHLDSLVEVGLGAVLNQIQRLGDGVHRVAGGDRRLRLGRRRLSAVLVLGLGRRRAQRLTGDASSAGCVWETSRSEGVLKYDRFRGGGGGC